MYDVICSLICSKLSLEWLGSIDEEVVSSVAEDVAESSCFEQSISWGFLVTENSSEVENRLFAGLISLISLLSSNFEVSLPGLDLTNDFFWGALNFRSSILGAREFPAVVITDWSWSLTSALSCSILSVTEASLEPNFFVFILLIFWYSRNLTRPELVAIWLPHYVGKFSLWIEI